MSNVKRWKNIERKVKEKYKYYWIIKFSHKHAPNVIHLKRNSVELCKYSKTLQ